MTKNTTKKRKRKNIKLRRQIRRTVAAIFMIMAIVVAAIPVEQFGTMQAADGTENSTIAKVYAKYKEDKKDVMDKKLKDVVSDYNNFDTSKSNSANAVTIVDMRNNGGKYDYIKLFSAVPRDGSSNSKGYVITQHHRDGENVTIKDSMSTGYYVITEAYVEEIINILRQETYTVKFKTDDSGSVQINGNKVDKFAIDSDGKPYIEYSGVTNMTTSGYFQNNGNTLSEDEVKEIIETYAQQQLNTHIDKIKQYNEDVDEEVKRQNTATVTTFSEEPASSVSVDEQSTDYGLRSNYLGNSNNNEEADSNDNASMESESEVSSSSVENITETETQNDSETVDEPETESQEESEESSEGNSVEGGTSTEVLTETSTEVDVNSEHRNSISPVREFKIYKTDANGSTTSQTTNYWTDRFGNLQKLEINYDNLSENMKQAFIKAMIVKRFKTKDEKYSLKGATLVDISSDDVHDNDNDKGIYAPYWQNIDDAESNVRDKIDDNGFLIYETSPSVGLVSISGIGKEAFKSTGTTSSYSLTLSNSVEFIGDDAFNGNASLTSANLANCKVIGNRAFENCKNLGSVTFPSDGKTQVIGAEAFSGCESLKSISFPKDVTDIGRGSFVDSGLESIDMSAIEHSSKLTIWPFAFYNCYRLNNINYGINVPVIGMGAFATAGEGSDNLKEFKFPESMQSIISDSSDTFKIGDISGLSDIIEKKKSEDGSRDIDVLTINKGSGELYYDYILAGRKNLSKVTFPKSLGGKIPDNTLRDCVNLECVVFGEMSYTNNGCCKDLTYDAPDVSENRKYDIDEDEEYLFSSIANSNFYVEGPGFDDLGNLSKLREITQAAKTQAKNYVPYFYKDKDNNTNIEMSYGDNSEFVANIIANADKTATLTKLECIDAAATEKIKDLTIGEPIGGYTVTALGDGCFDKVKKYILTLTIKDGSVSVIGNNILRGSESLLEVSLGNSVTSIGENAFSDCKYLENVYFTNPLFNGEEPPAMTIADSAFLTGSPALTFHGRICEGYAPYDYAMNTKSFNKNAGQRICYKTDDPMNLTVIMDNGTGNRTLIDYPHLQEIDTINEDKLSKIAQEINWTDGNYSLLKKFKVLNTGEEDSKYNNLKLREDENSIIMSTFMLNLPAGIDSIDAKQYFENDNNKNNTGYITNKYVRDDTFGKGNNEFPQYIMSKPLKRTLNLDVTNNNVISLYSDDNYAGKNTARAGLFSGVFDESATGLIGKQLQYFDNKDFNNHLYSQSDLPGNDTLTSINLGTVKYLPDYAFYSCENLQSVKIGKELATMGNIPFRGCSSLIGLEISDNTKFVSDNGIIYEKIEDQKAREAGDKYRIVECLEARGNLLKKSSVDSDNDKLLSNVTELADEAFAYGTVTKVDLSDTQITKVPKNCFANSKVDTVILPKSVNIISEGAFNGIESCNVYITNPDCAIDDAFDKNYSGTIYGYTYSDSGNTKESSVSSFCKSNNIDFKEVGYIVTFEVDGQVTQVQNIPKSVESDGQVAAVKPIPDPVKTGYVFKYWAWTKPDGTVVTGDAALNNITENRKLYAVFDVGNGVVSDGKEYNLEITGGTDSNGDTKVEKVKGGTAMTIMATPSDKTQAFQYWTAVGTTDNADYSGLLSSVHKQMVTFVMPNADVKITANYLTVADNGSENNNNGTNNGGTNNNNNSNNGNNSNNSSNNGSTDNNNNSSSNTTKYKVTVNYGTGSGDYAEGDTVSISANAPDSSTKVFSKWTTDNTNVSLASQTSSSTTFKMPASAVVITANYKTKSSASDDDDDDYGSSRRSSSSTTVSNATNNSGNTSNASTVTNTSGSTTTSSTAATGDRIAIDSTGISNKDVGSTNVEGATDNFVVKVSDSDEALALAEQALINKFGSLDGIVYYPMDISLYDASGNNKITDTEGLNVTVTIPIPDQMIQYGGNTRMAAIENGQLQDLDVTFTTIDGIACMSFTAPHFSPYVAYVDTNNLVAGQTMDATPKTGDPIHPKWFLALGMACFSVLLFATGDKKRKFKVA